MKRQKNKLIRRDISIRSLTLISICFSFLVKPFINTFLCLFTTLQKPFYYKYLHINPPLTSKKQVFLLLKSEDIITLI